MTHIIICPPAFAENMRAMARKTGTEEGTLHGMPIITMRACPPDSVYVIPAEDVTLKPEGPRSFFIEETPDPRHAFLFRVDWPFQQATVARPKGWRLAWLRLRSALEDVLAAILEWWQDLDG